jgi:membrane-associated phospholipid phosphatase
LASRETKIVKSGIVAGATALAIFGLAPAQASSTLETAGTAVAISLPAIAGGLTLAKRDWTGTAQLFVTTALTVGTVYGLKHFVRECRPFANPCAPGSDNWDSFPSDTSALAFAPAQFLWQRYGWQYGLPAYAGATFAGWTRVDARKHHWWDVAASAGISIVWNQIITTRYHPRTDAYVTADGDGVYAGFTYHL